ncbi:MAG: AI-2E family transporter [Planctomycetota bacterium]
MQPYIPTLSDSARTWVRFLVLLVGLAVLCWIVYRLRVVFTPLLVGAALAYVLNPLVSWLEQRWRVRRLYTVMVVFVLAGVLLVGGGFYTYTELVAQLQDLQQRLPHYVELLKEKVPTYRAQLAAALGRPIPETLPAAVEPAAEGVAALEGPTTVPAPAPWLEPASGLLKEYGLTVGGYVLGYLRAGVGNALSLVSLLILVPMFAFYFMWRFNDFVARIRDYLPEAYRGGIVHVARTIDTAIASFFRGRLLVCVAVGVACAIGWTIIGLPYSVPLGLLVGALNLVPFMTLLALPPALLAAFFKTGGSDWLWPVVLTMGVFVLVQALESFVLSPLIYGRSSGLHPLVIVVALLIGAELAGLLGLLLAIPVASTLRTLAAELVLPELRRLAGRPAAEGPVWAGSPRSAIEEASPARTFPSEPASEGTGHAGEQPTTTAR